MRTNRKGTVNVYYTTKGGNERKPISQRLSYLLDEARRIREAHAADEMTAEEAADVISKLRSGEWQRTKAREHIKAQ